MYIVNSSILLAVITPIALTVTLCSAKYVEKSTETVDVDHSLLSAHAPDSDDLSDVTFNGVLRSSNGLSSNLFLGNSTGLKRIHRERLVYYPIPWLRRQVDYHFEDKTNRIIKAIYCYDYKRTEGDVTVVSGGLGYSHVGLLFISQPSYGIDYAIEIYA